MCASPLRIVALTMSLLAFVAAPATCQSGQPRDLTIATKITPPFVVRDGDRYTGLSMDLWQMLAAELDVRAKFVEMDLNGMLAAAESGEVDLALAAVTITSEREDRMDFSHPFLSSGLGIATRGQDRGLVGTLLSNLFSIELLQALGALVFVLGISGVAMWLVERRANPEQFGGKGLSGPGQGFWFSAVTMTTVGYGDKAPVTVPGRMIALVWMFASIVIISGYTASIASALTVDQLQSVVRGPEDLGKVRVGTLRGSAATTWLDEQGVRYTGFANVADAMQALERGDLEAVVYDAPILKSLALGSDQLVVLPNQLRVEQYAIAMPRGSDLRKPLNRALIKVLQSEEWREARRRYLGE